MWRPETDKGAFHHRSLSVLPVEARSQLNPKLGHMASLPWQLDPAVPCVQLQTLGMKGWLPGPLGMFCGSEQHRHNTQRALYALTPLQARGLKQLSLAVFFIITLIFMFHALKVKIYYT